MERAEGVSHTGRMTTQKNEDINRRSAAWSMVIFELVVGLIFLS